jgi:predicted lipoprotein with Yx(FWY)xxD motif
MNRSRPLTLLATAAAAQLIALAVAACGGGGGGAGASPTAPPTTPNGAPATIGVASTGLGQILVNSQGRTLYLFQKDTGTTSTCTGACATSWPPLRATGQPAVGRGANAALLGTTPRSDGGPEVTYNGHPVYTFFQDQKPGDTNGEGVNAFGAGWFALSPTGNQVTALAPRGSTSSSGGAGGY